MAILYQLIPIEELAKLSEDEKELIWQEIGAHMYQSPQIMKALREAVQKDILPSVKSARGGAPQASSKPSTSS